MYFGTTEQDIEELTIVKDPKILNSPFIDLSNSITEYEQFKMVFLFPLALVRVITTFSTFILMVFLVYFEKITHINCEKTIHLILRGAVFLSGCWVTTKGIENLHTAPKTVVIIYNHISFMDNFVIATNEFVSGFTINYYSKVPIIGTCFKYIETLFFNHKEGVTNKLVQRLQNPQRFKMAIAAEGALSNGKVLLKFKSGAFVAKVPVLPVLVTYPNKFFNPAWTIDNIFIIGYRYFTQFINFATVEYLPVIYPNEEETPKEYAQRVREIMSKGLGVPMIELDVNDKLEFKKHYRMSTMRDNLITIT